MTAPRQAASGQREPWPASEHHCHAEGCAVKVPPRLLMCARHWRMVPGAIQSRIWQHYRPGQEITKTPTVAYIAAMQDAIAAVAAASGQKRGQL